MSTQTLGSDTDIKDLYLSTNMEDEETMLSRADATEQTHSIACLGSMPYDIINMIFKSMDSRDAACLALTCPKLYSYLKIYNEAPIPLTLSPVCSCPSTTTCDHNKVFPQPVTLAQIVAHWKTFSTYRFVGSPVFRFVKCAVYGGQPGGELVLYYNPNKCTISEEALHARYADYCRSLRRERMDFGGMETEWLASQILPSPHGMGLDWYRAVFDIIERFVHDFSLAYWSTAWRAHWGPFSVFKNNKSYFDKVVIYWHGVRSRRSAVELERKKEERLKNILKPEPIANSYFASWGV